MQFSIVVPVVNRPNEIEEFLESLSCQTDKDFEIIIMEGQST
ncbi:MAG: glycosyltransferase family 2 protein, partial [Prevotellaceae bacterium]|nr:glycosyltransferase family 2 protein [Prevotellaceae bacterium]